MEQRGWGIEGMQSAAMSAIRLSQHGSCAVLALTNPPVNAISIKSNVVSELHSAIVAIMKRSDIESIVIYGDGKLFSAGADIKDFDSDVDVVELTNRLFDTIENSTKPVIVAMHGFALGGGLELALSAHYRLARAGTLFAFPEITLGLIPGGGGTQRLPRLVGPSAALDIMMSGRYVPAGEALRLGLVDEIFPEDVAPIDAALRVTASSKTRPTRAIPITKARVDGAIASLPGAKPSLNEAPRHVVEAVAAIDSEDFEVGLRVEGHIFRVLQKSDTALGLRHAFLSERQVTHIPGPSTAAAARPIKSVGILGAGLMGTGIALTVLSSGREVVLVETSNSARIAAESRIAKSLARDVEKGRLTRERADTALAHLITADDLKALATVDLVIEAVPEDAALKCRIFEQLDQATKPDAILATNTSTLNIDTIAGCTRRPAQVVGLHFFSPANIMKLLEIVRGGRTAPWVLATAVDFAKSLRKIGVIAGMCDGFIGNRLFEEYLRQAYFLVDEGALPYRIDQALEAWGMAMGPFRTMDLAGQDIGWKIRQRRSVEQPDRPYSTFPDKICEMGRFGQKTGAGVYRYADGRTPVIDPEINDLATRHSESLGMRRREMTEEYIVERCIFALINEGAKVVEERIAYRPLDVDMVYVHGYGFPRERGGPLFYADRFGLPRLLTKMSEFARMDNGWAWKPAKLIERLAHDQLKFSSLNQ